MIQHDSRLSTASLEVLGDLFFSAPGRRKPPNAPNQHDQPAAIDQQPDGDQPTAGDLQPSVGQPTAIDQQPAVDQGEEQANPGPEQDDRSGTPATTATVHAFHIMEKLSAKPAHSAPYAKPAPQAPFCQQLNLAARDLRPNSDANTAAGADSALPERLDLDALLILSGALPRDRRLKAAWAALRRLAPNDGRTLVLTITETAAWLQHCGRWDKAFDPRASLTHLATMADGMVIIVCPPLVALGANVSLPAARVVLAESGKQAAIAAYAELKAAAADQQPAELFVIEGDSGGDAEQVYRRLAQVAISHLEISPTFAGHAHRAAEAECPLLASPAQPLTPQQTARLLAAVAINRHAADTPETPETTATPQIHDIAEPVSAPQIRDIAEPVSAPQVHDIVEPPRDIGEAKSAARVRDIDEPKYAPQVRDQRGRQEKPFSTLWNGVPHYGHSSAADDFEQPPAPPDDPPAAGPVGRAGQGEYGCFAPWQPQSRDELLKAVRAALPGVLPQVVKLLDPQELADDDEMPDLLAFDALGRPAGLVLSLSGSAADAARAASAADWVKRYGRLLSLASGMAQVHVAAMVPPAILLVPHDARPLTDRLALCGVRRMTWRGAGFGEQRGVIIEDCPQATVTSATAQRSAADRPATDRQNAQRPAAVGSVASNVKPCPVETCACQAEADGVAAEALPAAHAVQVAGGLAISLPTADYPQYSFRDEGLTQEELEALKKNLEIEEMT